MGTTVVQAKLTWTGMHLWYYRRGTTICQPILHEDKGGNGAARDNCITLPLLLVN